VIGPPESVRKVQTILDRLDRRPQQVYLSTVIGQLTLTNNFQFGVDWSQTFKKISGSSGVTSTNLNTAGIVTTNGRVIGDPRRFLTAATFPALSGLTIYGAIGDAVSVFVRALDARSNFKILARPAVYTANNKRAVISSGQRVPVPQSTLSNLTTGINNSSSTAVAATIGYEDVELRLEVIPLINSTNEVTLKIAQINDTLGSNVDISGNQVPIVNSQRLTTTVTIPSGATVVLGGLIQDKFTKDNSGIPYLMDVPYLGNFFKQTTNNRDETSCWFSSNHRSLMMIFRRSGPVSKRSAEPASGLTRMNWPIHSIASDRPLRIRLRRKRACRRIIEKCAHWTKRLMWHRRTSRGPSPLPKSGRRG
jgi:general secretion pathway protein D